MWYGELNIPDSDNKGSTGNGRCECDLFDELSELLGGRTSAVEPVEVASTWDVSLTEHVTATVDDDLDDNFDDEEDGTYYREPPTKSSQGNAAKRAKRTQVDTSAEKKISNTPASSKLSN